MIQGSIPGEFFHARIDGHDLVMNDIENRAVIALMPDIARISLNVCDVSKCGFCGCRS
jgi:hypothetical protein